MRPVKKTWFLKYLIALVISVGTSVVAWRLTRGYEWYPRYRYYPVLIPLVALSIVSVGGIMRRYVLYALEKVDTGNPAYNVLFKVILILSGIILFVPMLAVGVVTVTFDFIRDFGKAKEYRDYLREHPEREEDGASMDEDSSNSETTPLESSDEPIRTEETRDVTLLSPNEVNVVNPEQILITTESSTDEPRDKEEG